MSETKTIFTQGPWEYDESHTNAISIIAGRREIASVYEEKKRDVDDEMRANARLIAAAPDLLQALQNLVDQLLDYERVNNFAPNPGRKYCWDATEHAVAALAKAIGA